MQGDISFRFNLGMLKKKYLGNFYFRVVSGGIEVMYLSFVFVVFKFIRSTFIQGRILYIHYSELPDVDSLLNLTDQITLARELKDFWLEEELFAKLIFILRCPEVLFYITRIRKINPVKTYPKVKQTKSAARQMSRETFNEENTMGYLSKVFTYSQMDKSKKD